MSTLWISLFVLLRGGVFNNIRVLGLDACIGWCEGFLSSASLETFLWTCGNFSYHLHYGKLQNPDQLSAYRDRRFLGTQEEFEHALRTSVTVYVGNLSFYTTEEQIYEVFSRTGELKKIIMGLDKNSKTPCGFCFVVYDP